MALLPPAFLDELRARTSLVQVVRARTPIRRNGSEWGGLCPFHAEKSGSFTVNESKGFVHCFGCGAHGDAIGFVQRHDGLSFMDAVRLLAAEAGMAVPGDHEPAPARPLAPVVKRPAPHAVDHEKTAKIEAARDIWRQGLEWRGTLVETYLRARGVCPPADYHLPKLRFAPRLKWRGPTKKEDQHFPAQLAAVQDVTGRITGIHRTYLTPDGQGKAPVSPAKRMLGEMWGSAIRLSPAGRVMGIAEGIETGLAVRLARPDLPVWAAGSLGNVAGGGDQDAPRRRHPARPDKWLPSPIPDMDRPGLILPPGVEELLILADADGDRPTCEALVERAARRYAHRRHGGLRVRVAWPAAGMDFNDLLKGERV